MKVPLKLFAIGRQYLPPGTTGSGIEMEVPAGTRISDLLSRDGVPQEELPTILVNSRGIDSDRPLAEGDVVAVFQAMVGR